jgi:predicted nicotinamide N-methyase
MDFLQDYKTEKKKLSVEGIDVELLTIKNIDEIYDNLVKKGKEHPDVADERIPYWAELWPSAIALSKHIIKTKAITLNSRALELGCGLGLPGIIASKLGAKVIFSDYLNEALAFAKYNCELNNINNAAFELLDWRKTEELNKYPIILASDLAYEKRSFEHLAAACKDLLEQNGVMYLSEPKREYAIPFFDLLKESGFSLASFHYEIALNNINTKVNVYEIKHIF